MLSMKGIGKRVPLSHIKEKISRDIGPMPEPELRRLLDSLVNKKLLEIKANKYGVTELGMRTFAKEFPKIERPLRAVNEPWVIVYLAKRYYPHVAGTIVDFCKGRNVGFYCLFTEKRFFRRDFRGRKITIRSPRELLFYVDMHYIDVIPCVHRIGIDRPDWLVVDIDPGPRVSWQKTKKVAEIVYKIFDKLELNPAMKFSGSRGFQVWSMLKPFVMPAWYRPIRLRAEARRERSYFSLFADFVRVIQQEVDEQLPGLTTSEAARKAEREDLVLLDPASMKRAGLVRVPYGVHSKTGLVSLPVLLRELRTFKPADTTTEKALARYRARGNEFRLNPADPGKLLALLKSKIEG
jgi:DNA primase